MFEISQKNMDIYINKVSGLKKQFIEKYKIDHKVALDILKQMREIHGCALNDDAIDKDNIIKKGYSNTNNSDWIKLSTNASLLYVIHSHIRYCERLAYDYKKGNLTNITSLNESETRIPEEKTEISEIIIQQPVSSIERPKKESSFELASKIKSFEPSKKSNQEIINKNIGYKISKTATGTRDDNSHPQFLISSTEELSLGNIESEPFLPSQQNITDDLFIDSVNNDNIPSKSNKLNIYKTENTSEYIKNMTSTEASKLASEYEKKIKIKTK